MPGFPRLARMCGVLLVATLCGLLALEVVVRAFGDELLDDPKLVDALRARARGENPYYTPRAFYNWAHDPERKGVGPAGFLRARPKPEKTEGVLRVSCLGASTTARYPEPLRAALAAHTTRPVECLNWAVHGWTSAESLTNYFLNVQDYDSDLVLVLHAWNDVGARRVEGFRRDYTHYRVPWQDLEEGAWHRPLTAWSRAFAAWRATRGDHLDLAQFVSTGWPTDPSFLFAPETYEPFVRNVRTIAEHVRASGATPVLLTLPCREDARLWREGKEPQVLLPSGELNGLLGTLQHNELLRRLAREGDFALIDLEAWVRANENELRPRFRDMIHMDEAGQQAKAEFIAAELAGLGLLE